MATRRAIGVNDLSIGDEVGLTLRSNGDGPGSGGYLRGIVAPQRIGQGVVIFTRFVGPSLKSRYYLNLRMQCCDELVCTQHISKIQIFHQAGAKP